jgi:hypothetical protein
MAAWIARPSCKVHIKLAQKKFRFTKLLPICNVQYFCFPLKNHIPTHKSAIPAFDRAEGLTAGSSPACVRLGQRPYPPLRAFVPNSSRHGPPPGHGGFVFPPYVKIYEQDGHVFLRRMRIVALFRHRFCA